MPAVTCNKFGKGKGYYIAFRDEGEFTIEFYGKLISELKIKRALDITLPEGVTAHTRQDENYSYIFLENYNNYEMRIILPDCSYTDAISKETISGEVILESYGNKILMQIL